VLSVEEEASELEEELLPQEANTDTAIIAQSREARVLFFMIPILSFKEKAPLSIIRKPFRGTGQNSGYASTFEHLSVTFR
jgi:hypothetical protein